MSPTIQQALPKFLQIANHIRGQIARGELRPGDSPGILSIDGNYTQQGDGRVRIDVAGTSAGDGYDRLVVTSGAATLENSRGLPFFATVPPAK